MTPQRKRENELKYYHRVLKKSTAYKQAQKLRNKQWYALHGKDPERLKRLNAQCKRYYNDPKLRMRHEARWQARRAVKAGRIKRSPCSTCGQPKAEMHHPDYYKPLEVIWLCRPCHDNQHQARAALASTGEVV